MKKLNSIKSKVIFIDLIIMTPLVILICITLYIAMSNNNFSLNTSKLNLLEEKASTIAGNNMEVTKICTSIQQNTKIRKILSLKSSDDYFDYLQNNKVIQDEMINLTVMYPERQYNIMIFSDNGNSYFQDTLNMRDKSINIEDVRNEEWFDEVSENKQQIIFIPKYKSGILKSNFDDNKVMAVCVLTNPNTSKRIGVLAVVISNEIFEKELNSNVSEDEKTFLIDQHGKIIYSTDSNLFNEDISSNIYATKIKDYSKGFFIGSVDEKLSRIRFSEIEGLNWKLISYSPYHQQLSTYMVMLIILGLFILIVLIAIVIFNCNIISSRTNRINKNVLKVTSGKLGTRITGDYETEFKELCFNFNNMLDFIQQLMKKLEDEEQQKSDLEIEALQAQINPHFFYNTLATIRFMIEMEQYNEADEALIAFSKLLRKSFSDTRKIISIEEELQLTEEYLKLMQIRYQKSFVFKISTSPNINKLGILKNLIQPLVENSISHGFNMKEGIGHISITEYEKDNAVFIIAEDDGVGVDIAKINESIHNCEMKRDRNQFSGIGLPNVQMRIEKNYGKDYGLKAEINENGGVTFTVKMPLIPLGED